MNYTTFKESIVAAIKEKLTPEESIMESRIFKTNVTLDAITLNTEGNNVSPTIYIQNMYADFVNGKTAITELVDYALNMLRKEAPVSGKDLNTEELFRSENIQMKLVNTRANEEFLKTLPHREFLDLSIIYYVGIAIEDGNGSITITNELAEKHGYSEKMLYDTAMENLKSSGEARVDDMGNLIPIDEDLCGPAMYVICNESRLFGARTVLLSEELLKLANVFGGDFMLLPSSIHEWIAVPYSGEIDNFKDMVYEINRLQVSPQERLSDSVYRYNRETGTIEVLYKSEKPLTSEMEV